MTNRKKLFLDRACSVHGDLYDYTEVVYVNSHTKVAIVCSVHGIFEQTPSAHVNSKQGCPTCSTEKKRKTCVKRYGGPAPACDPKIQQKIKQTNIKRLGVPYPSLCDRVKEQRKATCVERYGGSSPACDPKIQQKIKQTNISNHKGRHNTTLHIADSALNHLNDCDWLMDQHITNKKTLECIGLELGVQDTTVGRYMKQHGIQTQRYHSSVPTTGEKQLLDFLETLDVQCIVNDRNLIGPYELDVYIPEHRIAIEFNGLYWHSEIHKSVNYHLNKTQLCEEQGIRLIHIFEDEWRDQQQKCKDTIKHLLGKSERGVYARQTTICEIPWKQAKDFLNQYHLLDAGSSGNYRIGAFDKQQQLIGVMVFGRSSSERSNEIELKRFVTNKKNNPGLGSKMFKFAVTQQQYQKVVAFVDRRWFTGLVKDHIGFEKVGETKPALWWTNGKERHHRRWKTKAKLVTSGVIGLNETKVIGMELLGYYRIWDSGKIKLQWNVKNEPR